MSVEGWALCRRGCLGYRFEKSDQGERVYRIDYRNFRTNNDYLDYLLLFRDAGWDHIGGSKGSGYQYFAARKENVSTDIFSDQASRAARYQSMARTWITLLVVYLALFLFSVATGTYDFGFYADPLKFYTVPDLVSFEAEPARFWLYALIETPFVLLRSAYYVLIPLMLGICLYCIAKAWLLGSHSSRLS